MLKIPSDCYKYKHNHDEIAREQDEYYKILGLTTFRGIEKTIEGAKFKEKNFTDVETMNEINRVKRNLREIIKIPLNPIKFFLDITFRPFKSYILKEEYLTPSARELNLAIGLAGSWLKLKEPVKLAELISSIIQYDDAYRYRFQDLMSETNKQDLIKKPIREIGRLLKIHEERSNEKVVNGKVKFLGRLLQISLIYGKIRGIFRDVIRQSEFKNFQLDEADKYFLLFKRNGYNFMGLTVEEREEKAKNLPCPNLYKC